MPELTASEKILGFILLCIAGWYAYYIFWIPVAIVKMEEHLRKIANSLEKIAKQEGADRCDVCIRREK